MLFTISLDEHCHRFLVDLKLKVLTLPIPIDEFVSRQWWGVFDTTLWSSLSVFNVAALWLFPEYFLFPPQLCGFSQSTSCFLHSSVFPRVLPVSSTNKAYCHDITEVLLQVALNTHYHISNQDLDFHWFLSRYHFCVWMLDWYICV